MEDVLDLYATNLLEDEIVVCMDESNKQQVEEKKEPLPCTKGEPAKYDYEYKRNGVSALFMFFSPDESWRNVVVEDNKITETWAKNMKELADIHFPNKNKIHVVLDNYATHKPSSFYEYYSPEIARRLTQKFVFHFTPVHASWLNMAEIEFSALFRQALNKRIPDQNALKNEVNAWMKNRNNKTKTVDWKFETKDARVKLKKLYPTIEEGE